MGITARTKVLVLNHDYQAIGVCSAERAFVLVYLQKAEQLKDNPALKLRTLTESYTFPSIIRLRKYIALPYKKVQLSRQNVFKRDGNQCVYCGNAHHSPTIDHVLPRSMGGKDTWENLVTACQKCNSKKGNLTPEEANMPLRYRPFKPSFVMFLSNFSGTVLDDWKPYLYMT